MLCPAASSQGVEGHLMTSMRRGGEGRGECCNDRLSICKVQELLPAKDIEALFVSESKKTLTRKAVYIKNGDKVRKVGS